MAFVGSNSRLAARAPLKGKGPQSLPRRVGDFLPLADAKNVSNDSSLLGCRELMQPQASLLIAILRHLAKAEPLLRCCPHFATHGLLSGESEAILKAKAEPALILTPPSEAAVKLTTRAFAELRAAPQIGRAEALRRSMAELITEGAPHEAHPAFWAPFVLVGEGAR